MKRVIGIDNSLNAYEALADGEKFICSLSDTGRWVDYYICKGRLGRLELRWKYGTQQNKVSGMFAEPLANVDKDRLERMDPKAKSFYLFAFKNNLGHLLNT